MDSAPTHQDLWGNESSSRGSGKAQPSHNKQKQMNTLEENEAATADRE